MKNKLNKRYMRNIKANFSFYLSATVLTAVTLVMFFMLNFSGHGILDFSQEFFETQQIEDAHFSTYLPISAEEIENLEEEYNVTLEAQQYLNIETDGVTARVFQKTDKIDLYTITVGEDATANDEIIISEGFAVNMNISIGDMMQIGENTYRITGFFQRPDYLYMLENEDDTYKNITTFYLAYMTDEAFEGLGDTSCTYLIRYNEDNSLEFRKAVNEAYMMKSYTAAEENVRITMVNDQAIMFIVLSYIVLLIVPLIVVVLVSIILSRKVKSEQQLIGTLSALGYSKKQLMTHYSGFAAIPGLVGGVFTVILSVLLAQPYCEAGLQDYEPMRVTCHVNPLDLALGIIVPTLMYIIAARLSVRKLLNKNTVQLLTKNTDEGFRRLKRVFVDSKMSFHRKFALRSIIGNPARSLVTVMGVFLGCYVILLGMCIFDSVEAMGDVIQNSMGTYEYEYVLNSLSTENTYGGAELLVGIMEKEDGDQLSIICSEPDNPYMTFEDLEGNSVDIESGYYITNLAAAVTGWEAGDEVKLYNPLTLEEKTIIISGIVQNDVQSSIITSRNNGAELLGWDSGIYNAIVSDEKLDIPQGEISSEIRKDSIKEQLQTIKSQMYAFVYVFFGLGVIVCVAAVYVAVNMMVTENRSNISMLKVLGYDDRRINKIVLNANHIFAPIGILLSIPAAYGSGMLFYSIFTAMFNMIITATIYPRSYVLAIGFTLLSYVISLALLRRKVKKVDLVESLKDNRE